MEPFLKWPGGKRWFISNYKHLLPTEYNVYFEPFLGGGSAFFYLQPQNAVISDINPDLINTYRVMAQKPAQLRAFLMEHQDKHNSAYYYQVRNDVPNERIARAARFLYLNRACFNGMYRVNMHGQFNVPIGSKIDFTEDINRFEAYSEVLRHANIRTQDFSITVGKAGEGDLIFADPPYTVAHNQNSFIKYNERIFSWKDQQRLLSVLKKARDRGAIIIATNAYYPALHEMYSSNHFYTYGLHRYCSISGLAVGRGTHEELLVTSYPLNNV